MAKKALLNNSLLEATEEKIESNLLPDVRTDYLKIVVSGMHAGLAGGPKSILAKVKDSKDPIHDCAAGAVGLVLLLYKHTKGTMPIKAMVPAGMTLMLHALDFASKLGAKIGNAELDRATRIYANTMFKNLGITPQMLQKGHDNIAAAIKDPAYLELMQRKAGLLKAPNASTPTGDANGV